jgi:hypothetical protein
MEFIGGIGPGPGDDNLLVGSRAADVGFGDPYSAGNEIGATDTGHSLSVGQGGADALFGRGLAGHLDGNLLRLGGASGTAAGADTLLVAFAGDAGTLDAGDFLFA